ncbi:MAG TPA: CpaF/VirB11 family protein [Candidatus Dormibacteraeota bacterium]
MTLARQTPSLPTPSGSTGAGAALESVAWPVVAEAAADAVNTLVRVIRDYRQAADVKASTRDEERLYDLVTDLIDQAIEQPGRFGLHGATARRLANDPGFRHDVTRGTMALSSWLFPLSRLIYLTEGIEEIHINRWDKWVLTSGRERLLLEGDENPFSSDTDVLTFFKEKVLSMPGFKGYRQLSEGHPAAEGNLGRVLRVCVVQEPAVSGSTSVVATIRLQGAAGLHTMGEYVQRGVMPPGVAQFLEACVRGRANIIIAGGTATGKTTLLRVLCSLVGHDEQILVIEDSAELNLDGDRGDGQDWHPMVQHLCTVPPTYGSENGITMRDLAKLALRMRPNRIILGEARDAAMAEVCLVASTGHDGSMVTVHADDAFQAVKRSAEYVMKSPDYSSNSNAYELAEIAVHRAFNLVVHLVQDSDGVRRISGILALGGERTQTVWIYRRGPDGHLERQTRHIGDLPVGLRRKLAQHLGAEVPAI